jgi:dipeptidyl aminopeptidase/acylaminoacyl peptidase
VPIGRDIWVYDLARDTLTRLTFEGGIIGNARWTPDGKRVVYPSTRNGTSGIFWKPADGSGPEEPCETLQERLKRGPIPVDEALPIAKQIAEALEAAYESSLVHRDLKPANIKLAPDGRVKG